jgi:hypothetical protein
MPSTDSVFRLAATVIVATFGCKRPPDRAPAVAQPPVQVSQVPPVCRQPQNIPATAGRVPAGDDGSYAWWLTVRFSPVADSILSVPVQAIDSSWSKATVLAASIMPPEAEKDPGSLQDSTLAFCIGGDFDRDGRPDVAAVGVYRGRDGRQGRFLVVLSEAQSRSWKKAYLATAPGEPGFLVLWATPDRTLAWSDCMECDSWVELTWNGSRYVVKSHPGGADESSDSAVDTTGTSQ